MKPGSLPETGTLYGCPQNLFKIPDFDAVMATMAEGDPSGHLVLPQGRYSAWTAQLKTRWVKSFPHGCGRCFGSSTAGRLCSASLGLRRDTEHRHALRMVLLEAADRELFEDMLAVREFEFFLEGEPAPEQLEANKRGRLGVVSQ